MIRAMDDLVRQGKVLYWGTSVWPPQLLRRTHRVARRRNLDPPIVEQVPYNLLQRWCERRVVLMARRLGMGLAVFSPLAGGILTGKYQRRQSPPPATEKSRPRLKCVIFLHRSRCVWMRFANLPSNTVSRPTSSRWPGCSSEKGSPVSSQELRALSSC